MTERTGTEAFTDAKPVGDATLSAYSGDTGNTARDNESNYSATGECRTTGWGRRNARDHAADQRQGSR